MHNGDSLACGWIFHCRQIIKHHREWENIEVKDLRKGDEKIIALMDLFSSSFIVSDVSEKKKKSILKMDISHASDNSEMKQEKKSS